MEHEIDCPEQRKGNISKNEETESNKKTCNGSSGCAVDDSRHVTNQSRETDCVTGVSKCPKGIVLRVLAMSGDKIYQIFQKIADWNSK